MKPLFLTQDTAMSKLWFKQDDKFFLPKACLNFEFFRYAMLSISHKVSSKTLLGICICVANAFLHVLTL